MVVSGSYAAGPAWALLPNNLRVRGANVAPGPSQQQSWGVMWGSGWDWEGTLKPQIDKAVALGLNTIRMNGAADYVAQGLCSRTTWLGNLTTFLDYCRAVGIYVYFTPGGGDVHSILDSWTSELQAAMNTAGGYADVIMAVDVLTEAFGYDNPYWPGGWLTPSHAATWNSIVRSAFPIRQVPPLTYSGWGVANEANFVANLATIATNVAALGVDYFDAHWYLTPAGTSWSAYRFAQSWWSVPELAMTKVLIGEFGAPLTWTSAQRVAYYQNMCAMLQVRGPNQERIAGACAWALIDQDSAAADRWSIFNNNGDEAAVLAVAPF